VVAVAKGNVCPDSISREYQPTKGVSGSHTWVLIGVAYSSGERCYPFPLSVNSMRDYFPSIPRTVRKPAPPPSVQRARRQQLVFELKNVAAIEREHINQLNRYLDSGLGKFGVLVTRRELPKAMYRNTIDLWSGQRRCIIALNDEDLRLMVEVFESKQRDPIEVLKRTYVDFRRHCPA
jgi:hypothetical protein